MEDLAAYEPLWLDPVETDVPRLPRSHAWRPVAARHDARPRCPRCAGLKPAERVLTLARVLEAPPYSGQGEQIGDTTNLVAVDRGRERLRPHDEPRARLGRLPPGLDVHLNSMLGEIDLQVRPLEPGARMESMMSPTLVARRTTASRSRPGPPVGRAFARRSSRC